jgi:hypothetical protein
MSTPTNLALTRLGVARARAGDWTLLDALEVRARSVSEPGFAGIAHAVGCEALAGYVIVDSYDPKRPRAYFDCPACDGEGRIDAYGANGRLYNVECPECDGDGELSADDVDTDDSTFVSDVRTWRTLSGEARDLDEDTRERCSRHWMNHSKAHAVIAKATSELVQSAAPATEQAA